MKVALVTGAGGGLGATLAKGLSAQGYAVGLHYFQNKEGATEIAREIESTGGKANIFQADLSDPQEAESLGAEVEESFGRLDVLIHNTGVYHAKDLYELSDEEWFEGLDTTVTAAFFTTRALLPLLRQSGSGRVINIGDSSCERIGARNLSLSYHIGKTGVLMLTKSLAQKEAEHGITANMISPGYLENSIDLPSPDLIPAGRFGNFEDILNAVLFLLNDASSYLTGSNLIISGGWNLR